MPAATTTTISFACSKCGTIKKSGKTSCCGLGGSWFRNCGSGGNSKLDHTWFEGIWACKVRAQSKTAIDQRLHAVPQLHVSTGADVAHRKAVITAATISTLTPTNTSTVTLGKTIPIVASTNTPDNSPMNISTTMSDSTSPEHDTGTTNLNTMLTTITSTSTNLLKQAPKDFNNNKNKK